MQQIIEILKNKSFYISFLIWLASVVLIGDERVGMLIIWIYLFIKAKDYVAVRATITTIFLISLISIIFKFLG